MLGVFTTEAKTAGTGLPQTSGTVLTELVNKLTSSKDAYIGLEEASVSNLK